MKTVKFTKDTNKSVFASDANTHYILEKGVVITVDEGAGINAVGSVPGRIIEVNGTIRADQNPSGGIYLGDEDQSGAGGGTIIIGKTGKILNEEMGIGVGGDDSHVSNAGRIDGYSGIGVFASNISVDNSGQMTGGEGVYITGDGAQVHNSGNISVEYSGIYLYGNDVHQARIINTGTIEGQQHSLLAEVLAGNVKLINRGTMTGDVQFGGGDDLYNGHGGKLIGTVYGRDGNDTYVIDNAKTLISEENGSGIDTVKIGASYTLGTGFENLTLTGKANIDGMGNEAANVLKGNIGDNTLSGDLGSDSLSGGKGHDLLTGGADADIFIFKTGFGADTITDFEVASKDYEVIDLSGVDGLGSFKSLQSHMSTVGGDTVIDFGHGDTLTLTGVAAGDLQKSDFIL